MRGLGAGSLEGRVLHLAQKGSHHGSLFFGRVKATSSSGLGCVFRVGKRGLMGRFGETRVIETTRAQVVCARRQFLGQETGNCWKMGLVGRSTARPSRVGGVLKVLWPVRGASVGSLWGRGEAAGRRVSVGGP